jgi:hypothetical protein
VGGGCGVGGVGTGGTGVGGRGDGPGGAGEGMGFGEGTDVFVPPTHGSWLG